METLKELIDIYGTVNAEKNDLEKLCKQHNANIKKALLDSNITDAEGDIYKVKLTTRKSESLDEEKAINVIQNFNINVDDIIKTKQYIDYDALEKAIYNHQIPNNVLVELDKCKIVKESTALTVKIKGGK